MTDENNLTSCLIPVGNQIYMGQIKLEQNFLNFHDKYFMACAKLLHSKETHIITRSFVIIDLLSL